MGEPSWSWTLHVDTDKRGAPLFAWLHVSDWDDPQERWVADVEFGPFDTTLDVYRWLARAMRDTLAARPC